MDAATAELLKQGILGLLLLISGMVIVALYRENKEERKARTDASREHLTELGALQAQRVADAQAVTTQLLAINQTCITALTSNASSLEAMQESIGELKQALRDLESEVRLRPRRPGG